MTSTIRHLGQPRGAALIWPLSGVRAYILAFAIWAAYRLFAT